MDGWIPGFIQTLAGVIIGGLITLGTTVWIEARRAKHQAAQRRAEQSEKAAQEIASTLIELRNLTRRDMFQSKLPSHERVKAEEELGRRIELLTLRLTDADARTRIQEVMDLSGWQTASPEYLRFEARDHLIECCGYLMRGEPLPPEPSVVQRVRIDVEEYKRLSIEAQEEGEREERARFEGEWKSNQLRTVTTEQLDGSS